MNEEPCRLCQEQVHKKERTSSTRILYRLRECGPPHGRPARRMGRPTTPVSTSSSRVGTRHPVWCENSHDGTRHLEQIRKNAQQHPPPRTNTKPRRTDRHLEQTRKSSHNGTHHLEQTRKSSHDGTRHLEQTRKNLPWLIRPPEDDLQIRHRPIGATLRPSSTRCSLCSKFGRMVGGSNPWHALRRAMGSLAMATARHARPT